MPLCAVTRSHAQTGRVLVRAIPSGGAGGGGSALLVQDTAPVVVEKAFWIRSTDMVLFVGYDDGDSLQWVEVRKAEELGLGTRVDNIEAALEPVTTGYVVRQVFSDIDNTNRSFGSGWTLVWTAPNHTNFKAGSKVKLYIELPLRNDTAGWGGAYIEPQVSFNNSTWLSLGSSGYDGNIMTANVPDIATYTRMLFIDPELAGITGDFDFRVRFYCRSYDGTTLWNQSHEINVVSGTASLLSGVQNQEQHYARVHIEELAKGEV